MKIRIYLVNFHIALKNIPARYFFVVNTIFMVTKFDLTLGNIFIYICPVDLFIYRVLLKLQYSLMKNRISLVNFHIVLKNII
jgi:hypothetical protein